jgi:hypothetical protein
VENTNLPVVMVTVNHGEEINSDGETSAGRGDGAIGNELIVELGHIETDENSSTVEFHVDPIEIDNNVVDSSIDLSEVQIDGATPGPNVILRQGPWLHPFPLIVSITIIALVLALTGSIITTEKYAAELQKTDYYHAPPNLAQLITRVQKSTLVVTCGESLGSGWVIALGPVSPSASDEVKAIDKNYPGDVITNYHVIKDCVENPKGVRTSNGNEEYEAILFSYDKENDLAIVSTKLLLPTLELSGKPKAGWWSMALGSPFGIEKSVSMGNVMNFVDDKVISSAPINQGNSGGPLVNSFGEVLGTNTAYLQNAQSFNIAVSNDLLCRKLVSCA